jgi:hypothetical protein
MIPKVDSSTVIEPGEFVKLKNEYKDSYPTIPSRMALRIEDIQQDEATVVFIDFTANKICRERIPVSVLSTAL